MWRIVCRSALVLGDDLKANDCPLPITAHSLLIAQLVLLNSCAGAVSETVSKAECMATSDLARSDVFFCCGAGSKALGLELRAKWMLAAVRLARQEDGAWRNPTMQLMVQPLGFL
jgi:hypothetical protein